MPSAVVLGLSGPMVAHVMFRQAASVSYDSWGILGIYGAVLLAMLARLAAPEVQTGRFHRA